PSRRITNQHWESLVSTSDEWIQKNIGIRERSRIGPEETTTDMGVHSAKLAIETAGVDPASIDFILCATNSQDDLWPSTAAKIQERLGIKTTSLDLQAGCSGWLFGVRLGTSLLGSGQAKRVLVVGSDALTRFLNYYDRDNMLFGDGSGSCILDLDPSYTARRLPVPIFDTGTLPSRAMALETIYTEKENAMEKYLAREDMSLANRPIPSMEGRTAMKYALTKTKESIASVLSQARAMGIEKEDIALYAPHQTNALVVQSLCEFAGFPIEKIPYTLDKYGGISTAGIPTGLYEHYRAGKLKKGDLVLSSAYGAGFTYGAMIFEWGVD
ncbi:MAG TPA: ketoacyl-ACP synthase III, partial [Leptospiraceae bacterium]|nr:ketoacyl-ACP synthase III [Leptospiraceae bacterium]